MPKSRRRPGTLDTEFFRNLGFALAALAITAGSITLSLMVKSGDTAAPVNTIGNSDFQGE